MYPCVLHLLAVTIFSSYHGVNCITWLFFSPNYPMYFENDTVTAACTYVQNGSSVSLLKDKVPIATFTEGTFNLGNIQVNANIYGSNLILFVTWEKLTEEDSGKYTCQSDQFNSAVLSLKVIERPKSALCESGDDNRQEYLVGEKLELTCYNPFNNEVSDLMPIWYVNDTTKLQGMGLYSRFLPRLSTATISLGAEENSTIFNCFLIRNDTIIQNQSYSCSVGPFLVYKSSFILLESFEGSNIQPTESVSFNCRIVPPTREVSYHWIVDPPGLAKLNVSASDTDSNLTLSDFELGTNTVLEAKITCVGRGSQQNFTAEHILTVSKSSTNGDGPQQFAYGRYILISSSGVLAFIATVVAICGCRFTLKKCFQRSVPKGETTSSTKDIGARNGDGITNNYFCGSGLNEHSDDYMSPSPSNNMKGIYPGALTYPNIDFPNDIEQRNQGDLPDDLYLDPRDKVANLSSRYIITPHGGKTTGFDAYGRPMFTSPHHPLPPMDNKQTPVTSSPEMIPTWDDELSYEEPLDRQSSHHSEGYPPEYESPLEEGISLDKGISDLWDYANAWVRR